MTTTQKTPGHLWAVGIVSLLWNGFGAYDYVMSKTENRDYLAQMADDTDAVIAWLNGFPLLMNVGWGLGVWGALAGSLLLLMRSRHAVLAFGASLVGAFLGLFFAFTDADARPPSMQGSGYTLFSLGIVIIAVALFAYAKKQKANGVLA